MWVGTINLVYIAALYNTRINVPLLTPLLTFWHWYVHILPFNTIIGPVWYNFPDESSMETDELPLLKKASYNLTPLGVHYVLCFVMYCVIWKFYFLFLGCISNTSTSFLNNFFLLRSAYLIFACIIIICREWSSLYPSIQGKTNIIVILLLYIIF